MRNTETLYSKKKLSLILFSVKLSIENYILCVALVIAQLVMQVIVQKELNK